MKRDGDRRKELQKAEYRNRKEGMETGWTEEERSTVGTAVRGGPEEGKGKNGRLSSQNRTEADERRRKRGESPKARARGKHRESGCGSETGKDERKLTESRVLGSESEARETGRSRSGRARKPKGRRAASEKPL